MRPRSVVLSMSYLAAALAVACSSSVAPENSERTGATEAAYSFVGFDLSNGAVTGYTDFARASSQANRPLVGRFNADALDDIALISTQDLGWNTIPVAFSNGDGTFHGTNAPAGLFPVMATQRIRTVTVGDFNGDKLDDILLIGGPSWNSVPIAFSRGDGTFDVANQYQPDLALLAYNAAVASRQIVVLDVNGDGMKDLVFVGGPTNDEVSVAYSYGDGYFSLSTYSVPNFSLYVQQGGTAVAGDFNNDGMGDIALIGGSGTWTTIPVALSNGDGFALHNAPAPNFQTWAFSSRRTPDSSFFTGDFNGDHRTDIMLIGGAGWRSIPIAMSNGDGSFTISNQDVGDFGTFAAQAHSINVQDFDGDSRTDIALVSPGWTTIPVAFSRGGGTFATIDSLNDTTKQFDAWAIPAAGHVEYPTLSGYFRATEGADLALVGNPFWNTVPIAHATSSVSYHAPPPACGDAMCNGSETCATCSRDCGSCPPPSCGDHVCNGGETCSSCPGDCGACAPRCGDGVCNGGETCTSCPSDCASSCASKTTLLSIPASGTILDGFFPYVTPFPALGGSGTLLGVSIPGSLTTTWNIKFAKFGHVLDCSDPADGDFVQVWSGSTLTSADMVSVFGAVTPALPVQIAACAVIMPYDPAFTVPNLQVVVQFR